MEEQNNETQCDPARRCARASVRNQHCLSQYIPAGASALCPGQYVPRRDTGTACDDYAQPLPCGP
jgi:hypothetical protein